MTFRNATTPLVADPLPQMQSHLSVTSGQCMHTCWNVSAFSMTKTPRASCWRSPMAWIPPDGSPTHG